VTVAARRERPPGAWRSRLRILGRINVIVAIIAALLVAIAHLPPIQARVAAFAVRLLHDRYGIDARIGRLDYNLLLLRGSVADLVLAARERPRQPFFRADRAAVDLGWPSLFGRIRIDEIAIVNPVVQLATDAQGVLNLPESVRRRSGSTNAARFEVHRVSIERLSFTFAETVRDAGIELTQVSLAVARTGRTIAGDLRAVAPGVLHVGRIQTPITALEARVSTDGSRVDVGQLRIGSPDGHLMFRGGVGPLDGASRLEGTLSGRLEPSRIAAAFDQAIYGAIDLSGRVTGSPDAPEIALHLSAPGLTLGRLPAAAARADVAVTRQAITFEGFRLDAPWARLQGRGRVGLAATDTSQLSAEWTGADVDAVLRALWQPPLRIGAFVSGNADARWTGPMPSAISGRVTTRAAPAPDHPLALEGTATLVADRGSWTLDHSHRFGRAVAVSGRNTGSLNFASISRSTLGGHARVDIASAREASNDLRRAGIQLPQTPGALDGRIAIVATASGRFEAPRLEGTLEALDWQYGTVTGIAGTGSFSASRAGLEVTQLGIHAADARATLTDLRISRAGALTAHASISARNVRPFLDAAPPWARLDTGSVDAEGTVGGTIRMPSFDGRMDVTRVGGLGQSFDRLHAEVSATQSRVVLRQLDVTQGNGTLAGNGSFDIPTGAYRLQADGRGLTMQPCRADAAGACPADIPLAAVVDATIDASGSLAQPGGNVSFDARDVKWDRFAPGRVSGRISAVGGTATIAARIPDLAVQLDAVTTLAAAPDVRLTARADGTSLPALLTAAGLSDWSQRVRGAITSRAHVTIPAGVLASASYAVDLDPTDIGLDQVTLRIGEAAHVELSPASVRVDRFSLSWGSSRVTAAGALTDTAGGELRATFDGAVSDVLQLGRVAGIPDTITATGRLQGTVIAGGRPDAPHLSGDLVVDDLTGTWSGRQIAGVRARVGVRDGWIDMTELSATLEAVTVQARGRAPVGWIAQLAPALPTAWLSPTPDGATGMLRADLTGSPSTLLQRFVPPAFVGEGELAASIAIDARRPRLDEITGRISVDRAALTVGESRLQQAAPGRVTLEKGRASLDEWRIVGDGTDLGLSGTVSLGADPPRFTARAGGHVSVAPAHVLTGTPVRGTIDVAMSGGGTFQQPELRGTLSLRDGAFSAPKLRVAAADVSGQARLEGDHLIVERLGGIVNGAPVSASGEIGMFATAAGSHVFHVGATGLPLQLLGGARAEVDVALDLTVARDTRLVSGRVDVTPQPFRGSVAVLKQLLAFQRAARAAAVQPVTPSGPPLRLDVAIVTRDNLVVDSSFGRVEVAADLRLVGTLERPLLQGQATLAQDGILRAGGKTYKVLRGSLDFSNPRRIEPSLNIAAETRIGTYQIYMIVTGPADAIRTSLSSDPPLSEADLRSLIVTGRLASDQANTGRTIGQNDVAQTLSGDVFGFAAEAIGLESVSVGTPDLDLMSGDIDAQTALNIRKAISRQVDFLFSQDLQDDEYSWMLIYHPRRSLQFRLLSREDREASLEFRQEMELARPPASAITRTARAIPPQDRVRPATPKVSSVRITGTPGVPEAQVVDQLSVRTGDRFDSWKWRRETERLEAFYRARERFSAVVRPKRTVSADGQSVALEYDVTEGPHTVLRVQGFALPDSVTADMQRAWSETLAGSFLLGDLERIVRAHLYAAGYLRAGVTATMPKADERLVQVDIAIEPGPRYTRTSLTFEGNTSVQSERLLDAIHEAGLAPSAPDAPDTVGALVHGLYVALGYLDVRVQVGPMAFEGEQARLPVRIVEGRLYRLSAIELRGLVTQQAAEVRGAVPVADGAPYVASVPDTARKRIQDFYVTRAYEDVDVQVTPAIDREHAGAVLRVTLDEGRRRVIDGVRIEGTVRTHSKVVSDGVRFRAGEPLGPNQIARAQKRLYDTGAFRGVEITQEPSGKEGATPTDLPVVATVRVEEAPKYLLRYGVQLSKTLDATSTESIYSVGGGVDIRDRSWLGRGISAGAGVRVDAVSQSARALLGTPATFGTRVRSNLYVSATREARDEITGYRVNDTQANFTAEQRLRLRGAVETSWGFAYDFRKFDLAALSDRDSPLAIQGWTAGPRTAIVWDTRDSPFDATRGYFFSSGLDLGFRALGSEIDYLRYLLQQFAYFPAGRVVFASAVRWGTLHTFGRENLLSLDLRFKAGGSRSVRGYAEDSLSTSSFFDVPLGGKELLVLNQEVRFPIYKWVKGVGFIDAGGTFADTSSIGPLRVGAGFGLRLASPFALVRVDLGFPVDPQPEDKPRVYFSIGQAF
jgi:outer membrane protein assembly factor BamA/autotransporter translocation and assembly factor TamB